MENKKFSKNSTFCTKVINLCVGEDQRYIMLILFLILFQSNSMCGPCFDLFANNFDFFCQSEKLQLQLVQAFFLFDHYNLGFYAGQLVSTWPPLNFYNSNSFFLVTQIEF